MDEFSATSDNLDQADEDILIPTVSDEALEAAADTEKGRPVATIGLTWIGNPNWCCT
jgi:hypothetical protein